MDNIRNCDSYINIPSSQTYISYASMRVIKQGNPHADIIGKSVIHYRCCHICLVFVLVTTRGSLNGLSWNATRVFSKMCHQTNKIGPRWRTRCRETIALVGVSGTYSRVTRPMFIDDDNRQLEDAWTVNTEWVRKILNLKHYLALTGVFRFEPSTQSMERHRCVLSRVGSMEGRTSIRFYKFNKQLRNG
jgi:hypothetical protein